MSCLKLKSVAPFLKILIRLVPSRNLVYLVHISKQKLEDCMDLLLINNENKSHYVYNKDFNGFMINKTIHTTKMQILFTMF